MTRKPTDSPSVLVLYHYLQPDDVVSAVIFSQLCEGLAAKGWQVTASSSNRAWEHNEVTYPLQETRRGVTLRRVWRPGFRQSTSFGRIANAIWMNSAWCLMALAPGVRPAVVVVGSDPILSPLIVLVWKLLRPEVRAAHWCFDLYPEAAIADGLMKSGTLLARLCRRCMSLAYRKLDLLIDIGSCMRRRLASYGPPAREETIVPWALEEPAQPEPAPSEWREALFGSSCVGLLYSGSFGRAHSWKGIPELARALEPLGGKVAFAVRGNAVSAVKQAFSEAQAPVSFVEFAATGNLLEHLAAADIHIVSLREEWTGTVVPSKFFGALAIGRPVLFIGSPDSCIAQWIEELQVGWILLPDKVEQLARELREWACSEARKREMFAHCHKVYERHFSRETSVERWDRALRGLVSP